jgi:hypothetical protein
MSFSYRKFELSAAPRRAHEANPTRRTKKKKRNPPRKRHNSETTPVCDPFGAGISRRDARDKSPVFRGLSRDVASRVEDVGAPTSGLTPRKMLTEGRNSGRSARSGEIV